MIKKLLCFVIFIPYFFISNCFSQNMLDLSTWTVGNGSVSGFTANGTALENRRGFFENPWNEDAVIWQALPDSNSNQDGGWNSSYKAIDNQESYRLTVWIKKTNSNHGTTFFGTASHSGGVNQLLNLSNTVNNNPYFWSGDLPQLDRWYLLVGYIKHSGSTDTVDEGAIYDGITGEQVEAVVRDFRFSTSATNLRHRAYLYYDTNTSDRQYFYEPRLEIVNGNEPSVNELLQINPDSKLKFTYDSAGNQFFREYCPIPQDCDPDPCGGTNPNCFQDNDEVVSKGQNNSTEKNEEDKLSTKDIIDSELRVFPNPTENIVNVTYTQNLAQDLSAIKLYNPLGVLVKDLKLNTASNSQVLDLSSMSSGVYFLNIYLTDGSISSKKIIKN